MNDSFIIELFWQRSQEAIPAVAEKYYPYLYSISYNILSNKEDSEECVNDTYLKAWDSIPPQKPNCLSAFLGRITRNISLNLVKKHSAQKRSNDGYYAVLDELSECIPSGESTEKKLEDRMIVDSIESFLYSKSLEKRNIFIKRYWYLCSVKEIAKAYSISENKVASLLFRMRNELKEHLEKDGIYL